ncbi:ketol-acid reductoisomerase [bacterium]|nr:ketol-acid reductoisomerase [candidate division CSSED10-310 bacterium]
MKIFYDADADMKQLAARTIAIIGYGSQGHAQAQNLRDSGMQVIVADVKDSPNWKLAESHGFQPMLTDEAAEKADIVQILVPDELQKSIYESAIAPHLKNGNALVFSHGFNIHFKQIQPKSEIDVYMVAPKGPGHLVRRTYEEGAGVPSLIAVHQNASGNAKDLALSHACGIGAGRAGIIETTFKEETETDLFGEQTVLCGGVTELVKAGFETLINAGYQPEIAYFECMHELKLIVDLFYQGGIGGMYDSVSNTAEYGGMTRGTRIINEDTKKRMQQILEEIQNGSFAKEWIAESQAGRPNMEKLRQEHHALKIENIGKELRDMMTWIKNK